MMTDVSSDKSLTRLLTRASYHRNISVLFLTQDYFYNGTERRAFTRSARYLVLFQNPLDFSTIYAIANKIAPKNVKGFLRMFQAATNKPNGYLFGDGRQSTPSIAKFRTDIFGPYQRNFILTSTWKARKEWISWACWCGVRRQSDANYWHSGQVKMIWWPFQNA